MVTIRMNDVSDQKGTKVEIPRKTAIFSLLTVVLAA